jgi:3',5'-cyclic AMP phosphodiesterase CpdA
MFRLAHFSDIHLGPLPELTYRQLISKRITGYINWHRNRRMSLNDDVLDEIVDDMLEQKPDHIALSGDLVNLALDLEIEVATAWLEDLGKPDNVSVVPGNHDAYVPGALGKACKAWGPWMLGDGARLPVTRHSFPFLRVRGPVAIIGLSSARATAPFMASGFFEERQGAIAARMLEETKAAGLFRVVMIHHPPVRGAAPAHKRLYGIGRFQKMMARYGAELVLHGHTHLPTIFQIPGRDHPVPVVGVAAAGQSIGGRTPAAQYNLFEIAGDPGEWDVTLIRRGTVVGPQPVTEISRQRLDYGPTPQFAAEA